MTLVDSVAATSVTSRLPNNRVSDARNQDPPVSACPCSRDDALRESTSARLVGNLMGTPLETRADDYVRHTAEALVAEPRQALALSW